MKTVSPQIHHERRLQLPTIADHIPHVRIPVREILALLSAVTVATGIMLLSIWLSGVAASDVIGATGWVVALLFFGLAIDSRRAFAVLQTLTGFALIVLAWLQQAVSAEYPVWLKMALPACCSRPVKVTLWLIL